MTMGQRVWKSRDYVLHPGRHLAQYVRNITEIPNDSVTVTATRITSQGVQFLEGLNIDF